MTSSAKTSHRSVIQKLNVHGYLIRSTKSGLRVFHECEQGSQAHSSNAILSMIGAQCVACGYSKGMEIPIGFLRMYPGFTIVDDAVQRRTRRRQDPCPVIRGKFKANRRAKSHRQRKADDERNRSGL